MRLIFSLKNIFILSICFIPKFIFSQNLVPNPSFEEVILCPDGGAQIERTQDWYIAEKTPDFFHSCSTIPTFSVPDNLFDFQFALSGNSYCGFCAYSTVDTTYREKIGVRLTNPLSVGVKYFISFKVSATKNYLNGASNKLGVLFSLTQYSDTNPSPTINYCQYSSDSLITDTLGWVTLRGSFISDSTYRFLTVGNFFQNFLTDTISFWNTNALQTYYFIDEICVSPDSIYCDEIFTSTNNHIYSSLSNTRVYYNTINSTLTINCNSKSKIKVSILSLSGSVLSTDRLLFESDLYQIDLSNLNGGIYLVQLISIDYSKVYKIFIPH